MQSIERGEENNYNCAHETEKHSPVIIDNDEYSAIENITKWLFIFVVMNWICFSILL